MSRGEARRTARMLLRHEHHHVEIVEPVGAPDECRVQSYNRAWVKRTYHNFIDAALDAGYIEGSRL